MCLLEQHVQARRPRLVNDAYMSLHSWSSFLILVAIVTFSFYCFIDCGVAKPTASQGTTTAIGQEVGSVSARTTRSTKEKTKAGK